MMTTCPPAVSFNSRYARPSPPPAPPQHFPRGRRDGPGETWPWTTGTT